jgi:hypothetical protein
MVDEPGYLQRDPAQASRSTVVVCSDRPAWCAAIAHVLRWLLGVDAHAWGMLPPPMVDLELRKTGLSDPDRAPAFVVHFRGNRAETSTRCIRWLLQMRSQDWMGGLVALVDSDAMRASIEQANLAGGQPDGDPKFSKWPNVHRCLVAPVHLPGLLEAVHAVGRQRLWPEAWQQALAAGPLFQARQRHQEMAAAFGDGDVERAIQTGKAIDMLIRQVDWPRLTTVHEWVRILLDGLLRQPPPTTYEAWRGWYIKIGTILADVLGSGANKWPST